MSKLPVPRGSSSITPPDPESEDAYTLSDEDFAVLEQFLKNLEQESKTDSKERKRLLAAARRMREILQQREQSKDSGSTAVASSSTVARDAIDVGGDVHPGAHVGGNGTTIIEGDATAGDHVGVKADRIDTVIVNHGNDVDLKPDDSISEAQRDYLLYLRKTASRVPLGKLDLQMAAPDGSAADIRLRDIYVPLDIMRTQRALRRGSQPHARVPVPVLDPIIRNPRLVILGDPGSGKTTLLNFLTYQLAGARLFPSRDFLKPLSVPQKERRRAANWRHGALLPVRVELRDFIREIPKNTTEGSANLIWTHITRQLKKRGLDDFSDELRKILRKGKALIMFDGLDEIIDLQKRQIVRDAVTDFADTHAKSRFIVTCRVLSYTDPEWQLTSFPEVTLAPLNQTSMDMFIDRWYAALARLRYVTPEEARFKAKELRDATLNLSDLAQNPMLLTVMAVVHTYRGTLPRERARLYNDCVQLLLWDWQRAKQIAPGQWERGIVEELDTREERLINGLCEVAFKAHSSQGGKSSLVNIPQKDILSVLKRFLNGDWGKAQRFCEYVEKRAGLLIGKGQANQDEPMFAFPHRGFQEFLAARHIVSDREFDRKVADLARQGDVWHEVLLLAVGHLVFNHTDVIRPLNAINLLCPENMPEQDAEWRALWLAAEMLTIVGRDVAEQDPVGMRVVPRLMKQLVTLASGEHLTPVERAQAADVLGWLGDPRPGVSTKEPELVAIKGGKFKLGGEDDGHSIAVKSFSLARYPVTNAQFRRFFESKAYQQDKYWTEVGLKWRERSGAKQGGYVNEPWWGTDNRPVVGISWHEAVAYANWLSDKSKKKYRLPTEAEWEFAAAGEEGRRYPFGNRGSDDYANTREAGIGQTTAVGIFPQDKTPDGIHDMGGNVWEWCSTLKKDFPYKASDGREDLNKAGPRILRGGAYDNTRRQIHCTHRRPVDPGARVPLIGFRLASEDT